jgi:general secretion pathway protein K
VGADGKPNQNALDRFRRLLDALQLPVELADTLLDWLDADDDVSMGGAEQVEYLSLQPPYRAFNGPMASPSELWLIKGMTAEIFAKLTPYVATLPREADFNVSTVSKNKPELIMCLAPNISQAEAVQVLENRGDAGFTSREDFTQDAILVPYAIAPDGLTVKSDYFMVTSHVQVGRSVFTTYSLLKRSPSGTYTVMRAQGTY